MTSEKFYNRAFRSWFIYNNYRLTCQEQATKPPVSILFETALMVFLLLFHLDQLLSFIAYWHYSICKKVIQYAFWNGFKTEKAIKNVSISEILHIPQMCMEIPALQAVFTLTSATYAWYGTNNKVERQLSRRAVLHLY